MNEYWKIILVNCGLFISPLAKAEEKVESPDAKVIESIRLRADWSVSDLKALAKKMEDSTPGTDSFKVASVGFYDLEDSIALVIKKEKQGERVGGWRVTITFKKGNYVYLNKEWFDI
jgi:hypothetical protein